MIPSTPHKTLVCKCGEVFSPLIGFNGIIQSKLCLSCRYDLKIQRYKTKTTILKPFRINRANKELKSKTTVIRKSRTTEQTLIAKLDRVFSLFIRQRDSKDGYFECISCGKIKPYKQADCGHFVNRSYVSTRYDEINCNAQCRNCNRYKKGSNQGYRRGLLKKYGVKAEDILTRKKSITLKLAPFEIELMIVEYKEKLNETTLIQ